MTNTEFTFGSLTICALPEGHTTVTFSTVEASPSPK
jgi:hypothetical protein